MKYLYVLLLVLWGCFGLGAATVTTSQNGNWNDGATWGGSVPSSGDYIIVNHNVTVTANQTCRALTINSGKVLTINGNITLTVDYSSIDYTNQPSYSVSNSGTITFDEAGNNILYINSSNGQSWPSLTNSGTINCNSGQITMYHTSYTTVFSNSGTFNAGYGTVRFNSNGAASGISGTVTFFNVIGDNVRMKFGSSSTVNGIFKVMNGAYVDNGEFPAYGSDAILDIAETISLNGNYYLWPNANTNQSPSYIYISSGTLTVQNMSLYVRKGIYVQSGATFAGGGMCMFFTSTFEGIINQGTIRLGGLTIQNGCTWNINTNYTASTLKIENGGTVNAGSYNLGLDNSLENDCNISSSNIMDVQTGGTFNAQTSTVTIKPAYWVGIEAYNVSGGIVFNNVVVDGNQTLNVSNGTTMTINGNLTVNSGAVMNAPQNINFGAGATVNNSGSTSNGSFPANLGSAASGNNGGGNINASKWIVTNPTNWTATSNITFTGSPKVVVVQSGATLNAANYTITCDSVYINGNYTSTNSSGLAGTFGSAVIVMGSASTITYNAESGSQSVTPRSDYVNLVLSGSATKTFGNGTYEISGNFSVTGTYPTYNSGSLVRFDGTNQNISSPTFGNVQFTNSGTKTLQTTTEVSGIITLGSNVTLASGGNLVLISNASGTAGIAEMPSGASVTGNITVQRYVPAVIRRSRMISPNTSGFTFAGVKDDIFVSGAGGASNGFDVSTSNQPTAYTLQESTSGGRGWKAISTINAALSPGEGALVFVRGDRSLPSPNWYTAPYVSQNEVVMDFVGPLNTGSFSPTVTYTSTGVAGDDGWNMVGNPYPSAIDWNSLTKNNLAAFYYIYEPASGSYVANDDVPIASGQGFLVQAIGSNPSITFTESSKTSETPTYYFKTANKPVSIRMIKDSINSDIAFLRFRSNATKGVDLSEDAPKFQNAVVNFGFFINANNSLQYNTTPNVLVADTFIMFANASNGNYTLKFDQLSTIPQTKNVYLRDLFTNTITDLRVTTQYVFSINSSAASKGNRFQLIVIDPSALPVKWLSVSAENVNDNVVVKWSTASEKNNAGFTIEKSFDGNTNWDFVQHVGGNENASTVNNYSYFDEKALQGITDLFYRVKQTDKNGDVSYSNVVRVENNKEENKNATVVVYPNPATSNVSINVPEYASNAKMEIYDIYGKLVLSRQLNGEYEKINLNIDMLKSGVYTIKLDAGNQSLTSKFIKQ